MEVSKRDFYRRALLLIIPLAIQNLINAAVQIADVIMLKPLGEVALSAANLGGQIPFIINLAFFGLASGMVVLTAQFWGKQDLQSIKRTLGIAMRFALIVSFCCFVLCFIFAPQIMKVFSSDARVVEQGAVYLRTLSVSYCFTSITMTYLCLMRSLQKVKVSTVIYIVSLFINIGCNYVLINGKLGFPTLGVTGAAIGTLIARVCETIMVLVYNKKLNPYFKFRVRDIFSRDRELSKEFFKYSLPVIFNEVFWSAGMAACSAILGQLGSAVSGAFSVVSVTRQLAMVLCIGVANAAAVILGNDLGRGNLDTAWSNSKRIMGISTVAGIIGAGIVLLARGPILENTKNLSPQGQEYLAFMLLIIAVSIIMQSFNCTIIVGILRSGGDTKMGLLMDVGSLWFGAVLFGAIAAFLFKAPVRVVFCVLMIDEVLKLGPCLWRWLSRKWVKNVTTGCGENM